MAQPLEMLDTLVDAGLMESKGRERYQVHQAIADYIAAQEKEVAVAVRFARYYADWLAAEPGDAAVEVEIDNLLTAVSLATKNKLIPTLIALTNNLLPFLERRSQWELLDQLAPQAAQYAQNDGDYQAAISLLHRLSRSYDARLNHDQAECYLTQALDIARHYDQVEPLVAILSEHSLAASHADEIEKARAYLDEALTAARQANYTRGVSMTLGYLGRLSHQNGDHEQTPLYLDEAIAIAREHTFNDLLCGLLILRGAAASYSETADAAETYYLEALVPQQRDFEGLFLRESRSIMQIDTLITPQN